MHHLAPRDSCGHACLNRTDEHGAETFGAPPLADASQARMVRQHVGQAETCKPADCDVDLGLAHQTPVVDDADKEASEHETQRHLGVNARPSSAVGRVAVPNLRPEPAKVEHLVYPGEHMIVGKEVAK